MSNDQKALLQAEARARVQKALDHIEAAQGELCSACQELSALVGGIPSWKAASTLYDRVKALWYRVEGFRTGGRYTLDSVNAEAFLRRLQQRPTERERIAMCGHDPVRNEELGIR